MRVCRASVPLCTALYRSIPLCTALYRSVPLCTALYRSVPLCTALYCSVPLCTALYRSVPLCTALYRSVPLCTALYRSVPLCTADITALLLRSHSRSKSADQHFSPLLKCSSNSNIFRTDLAKGKNTHPTISYFSCLNMNICSIIQPPYSSLYSLSPKPLKYFTSAPLTPLRKATSFLHLTHPKYKTFLALSVGLPTLHPSPYTAMITGGAFATSCECPGTGTFWSCKSHAPRLTILQNFVQSFLSICDKLGESWKLPYSNYSNHVHGYYSNHSMGESWKHPCGGVSYSQYHS